MKKRISQQKQRNCNRLKQMQQRETILKCYNSEVSWEDAYSKLENGQINTNKVHSGRIRDVAAQIESSFVFQVSALQTANTKEKDNIIHLLLANFPIMRATRNDDKSKDVLIDIKQLVLAPECFSMLFEADDKTPDPDLEVRNCNTSDETPQLAVEGPTRRLGRPPLWIKYPDIVETATQFIKQQSFAAHSRKRESTGTGTGVTLKDLQQHLLDHVPGLKEHGISRDTLHHLMVVPKKNSSRAYRYKGYIDAKVTAKKNDYREGSSNQHFLFARVNYREELCAMFSDECRFYSSDDMNKLRMGPSPAVSRYHQQHRFLMRDDTPNLWDHDFPIPGYLITTSGYQMQSKAATHYKQLEVEDIYTSVDMNDYSEDPEYVNVVPTREILEEHASQATEANKYRDKPGRLHYKKTTYGPAVLILASKFTSSSG